MGKSLPTPPPIKKKDTNHVTMIRQYELLTPLFGGGVEANVVDEDNPIRGTSVRGQLRFWWRATRGGRFGGSLEKMKAAEDAIWGAAAKEHQGGKRPLPVQVAIYLDNAGSPVKPFIHERNRHGQLKPTPNPQSGVPAYAAFPLQRTDEEIAAGKEPYTVQKGVTFTLRLDFHEDYREDVETAIWAWETFGGIGARTRRGFGAIYCSSIRENGKVKSLPTDDCNTAALKKSIKNRLKTITGKWPEDVPHLSPKIFLEVVDTGGDSIGAWNWLITALRQFRQSREGNQYGPTHWPEANAVRSAVRKPVSSKSPNIGTKFPRAQLGLPILFHFPQERNLQDATLTGKKKERMASRLILRPLSCGRGRGVGLAAVLISPIVPDGGVVLDGKPVGHTLSESEAKKIKPLQGEPSVIKAFFNYIRS